jgi:hypothetical protein
MMDRRIEMVILVLFSPSGLDAQELTLPGRSLRDPVNKVGYLPILFTGS